MKRPNKIQRWWYRRGHRPKNGSWLYSPSLALQYAAMEALLGVKHTIHEAQRRMGVEPDDTEG